MSEDIPTTNDLIVIGTGLTESIIAAAASRVGKKVLHIDHRDYYGGNWATFSFGNISCVLQLDKQSETSDTADSDRNEGAFVLDYHTKHFEDVKEQWFCPDEILSEALEDTQAAEPTLPTSSSKLWAKCEILKDSRKFNFDLAPKVLFARGEMVEILISSGICRYAEFKTVSTIYTYDTTEKRLIPVPCSRADVFSSKDISMIEKRLLMKALSRCAEYDKKPDDLEGFKSKSFGQFLDAEKIHGKIRQYILDTVAIAKDDTDFSTAVKSVQKFVCSTGRYGNTPFLWTLYGSGELPQCFCRCSAVFGGVYCLKHRIRSIATSSDGSAVGVMSGDQLIKASFIVVESSLVPQIRVKAKVSRAILLTDRSLIGDHVALINFPSFNSGKDPVRVIELSSFAMACPRGLFVVHLMTRQVTSAEEDLKEAIDTLFYSGNDRPKILWSLHFTTNEYDNRADNLPSNVYLCSGPNSMLDCDDYVIEAKNIFQSLFPGEEFLPKVPDPEDIILDEPCDDNNTTVDPTANEDPVTQDHVTGDRTNDDKQESVDP